MLVHSLLLHARAAQPCVRSPAMAAGEALPVKAEVRSEPWERGSQSERAVHIEVIRPARNALGQGARSVPADTVGRCGVTVLAVDETGFHTDSSTTRPRAMLTGTVFVKPRYRRARECTVAVARVCCRFTVALASCTVGASLQRQAAGHRAEARA